MNLRRIQAPPRFCQSLCGWLTVWLLAMPLVHIHPEADHRHGIADHVHGGQFHTLLSTALSCEFARSPEHDGIGSPRPTREGPDRIGLPGHILEHPGVAFTVLVDSMDRSDIKLVLQPALMERTPAPVVHLIVQPAATFSPQTFPRFSVVPSYPRGPPLIVV